MSLFTLFPLSLSSFAFQIEPAPFLFFLEFIGASSSSTLSTFKKSKSPFHFALGQIGPPLIPLYLSTLGNSKRVILFHYPLLGRGRLYINGQNPLFIHWPEKDTSSFALQSKGHAHSHTQSQENMTQKHVYPIALLVSSTSFASHVHRPRD